MTGCDGTPGLPTRALIGCVRAYQLTLSPFLGRHCRFQPTCSHYAIEALRVHGAWRGSWLALRRVGRCQPLGGFGYDPVPPPRAGEQSPAEQSSSS